MGPSEEVIKIPQDLIVDLSSEFTHFTTKDFIDVAVNRVFMGDTIYFSQHASEKNLLN